MAILAAMTQDVGNKAKGYVAAVMLFVFNFFFVMVIACPAAEKIISFLRPTRSISGIGTSADRKYALGGDDTRRRKQG
jgi:hypothetical protein